jgi:hypothetical protein
MRAAHRAGNQAWIGGNILVDADIDEGWRLGGADETGELV